MISQSLFSLITLMVHHLKTWFINFYSLFLIVLSSMYVLDCSTIYFLIQKTFNAPSYFLPIKWQCVCLLSSKHLDMFVQSVIVPPFGYWFTVVQSLQHICAWGSLKRDQLGGGKELSKETFPRLDLKVSQWWLTMKNTVLVFWIIWESMLFIISIHFQVIFSAIFSGIVDLLWIIPR
jgi:hypothetical protein